MLIEVNHLTREYRRGKNNVQAVDNIHFTADKGDFVIIKGESGSGKSTFLSMLAGLLHPTSGSVFVIEKNIYELSDKELSCFRNSHIGYIPQGHELLSELTVYENVVLPQRLYRKTYSDINDNADKLLKKLGIGELRNSYPCELSGGERKRAAIARAIANSPDVILADEPTNDLDGNNTAIVLEAFSEIAKSGTVVIMITHDNHISSYGSRIMTMKNGKLV